MTGPELVKRLATIWRVGAEEQTATRTQTEKLVSDFYWDAHNEGFAKGAAVSYESHVPKEDKK